MLNRSTLTILVIVIVVGVMCAIGLGAFGAYTQQAVWIAGSLMIPSFFAADFIAQRSRRKSIDLALSSRGFSHVETDDPLRGQLEQELQQPKYRLNLRTLHRAYTPDGMIVAVDYEHVRGHGRFRELFRRFRVMCDVSPQLPEFALLPRDRTPLERISRWLKPPHAVAGHRAFDRRWRLDANEPAEVALFLGPNMIEWLAAAPKHESWALRDDRLICHWEKTLSSRDVVSMLDRVAVFQLGLAQAMREARSRVPAEDRSEWDD